MIQKIRTILIGATIGLSATAGAVAVAAPASAVDVWNGCDGQSSQVCGATSGDNAQNMMKNVINTLLIVLGIIAVIMIVIGGMRYVLSGGDASSTKAAKDTILYSVIGLVVAIFAYAIVNFVVGAFGGGGNGGNNGGSGGTNQQGGTGTNQNGGNTTPPPAGGRVDPNEE